MEKRGKTKKVSPKAKAPDGAKETVRYQVVEFSEERKGTKKMVDFVPAKWIDFDPQIGKCVAKFLDGIIGPDERTLLNDLRRTQADAPASWGWFPVVLRGEAKTFKEATAKAITVETELYAYSTDNDEHAKEKSIAAMKKYEERSRNDKKNDLQSIMEFENENDTSETEANRSSSEDSDSEESADSEHTIKLIPNKQKKSPLRSIRPSNQTTLQLKKKESGTKQNDILPSQPKQQRKESNSNTPIEKSARQNTPSTQVSISQSEQSPKQKDSGQLPTDMTEKLHQIDYGLANHPHRSTIDNTKRKLDERAKNFSHDTQLLYHAITELTVQIEQNSEHIKDLRRAIEGVVKKKINPVKVEVIVKKFGVTLPLHTHAEIEDLNQKLSTDVEFCTEFITALQHLVENDLPKTMVSIAKKIFDRLLAMECTAVKKVNGKYLLRDTKLYTVLFDLACAHHNGTKGELVTEQEFKKALASAIYNAKDWDGHRSLRKRQVPPPPVVPPPVVPPPVVPPPVVPPHVVLPQVEMPDTEGSGGIA